jgi:hypothetical protein
VKTFIENPGASDSGLMYLRDYYDLNGDWNDFQEIAKYMISNLATQPNYPIVLLQIPDITKNYRNN